MWPAIIIAAVALIIFFSCMRVVPQAHQEVIERLGKYRSTWDAGLHVKAPFIEKIAKRVTLKEQVLDTPPQPVITSDNVTMQIDAVVYYKVFDAKLYTYGAYNPVEALANLTATTLRNIVGEMSFDESLTSRDIINGKMQMILDEATDPWGIKVNRVEIRNITPPKEIREAMEKQMKAERERRETLLQAEGHKAAVITRAEGDKQAMILEAEGERDARIARAEGEAKALLLQKQAEADGLKALMASCPNEAVLELKKYEALVEMANGRAAKLIVPTDAVEAVKKNVVFSETTELGNHTLQADPEPAPVEKDPCCDRFKKDDEE